ncbi:MAG: 3-methyl-2-oxobutanoate hydroxymethyltransferase [Candidatus Eisenbacteria bacterium]|uniref:3-methyl-2-oxobutanoate hydroxymethyltransferase n=1 Tax=Eiseniibacteriota bacterium TaxID=2212470 RepID=A0A9D6LBS0_UNCEI|nr:3-methyl-2-oxobutanoate hydroxymethyltransferase [Candidatus Eisenbacteria bacterium]MBI3540482.1 3-methyl-2-oxobutanoate hydroxymethyltransferase [Candidatus Eisenbacteria bacterium]
MTAPRIVEMKRKGEAIAVLTAYDYPTARIADEAGAEILLVGDSLGTVVLGYENTLPVTMEDMLHHTRAVMRAKPAALVVADMPFLSYQVSDEQAILNAGRFIQEGGADAVKLEGGERVTGAIRRMVAAGIPVMGHLGLTPQSVLAFGGYKVQARGEADQERLVREAGLLQNSGCFALVLEGIPARLGAQVTRALAIPTIGIGAGVGCDGQVLVSHDLLGLFLGHQPKFVRRYAAVGDVMREAFAHYVADVKARRFPSDAESY